QARFTTLALPIVLLVAFVSIGGGNKKLVQDGRTLTTAVFFVPGLIALAVVSASFSNLLTDLVAQRDSGILKRRRATPLPAYALSGLLLPTSTNPDWLNHAASALPLQHLAHALHHAFDPTTHGLGISPVDLAVLAAWAVAALTLAAARFTWLPHTTPAT